MGYDPEHPKPLTVAEIAEVLGVTPRTVQLTLKHALKKLRERVPREEFEALMKELHPRE